ncbi:MAG: tryptophan synthase subunit alpha [Chloroflexia bacterium]
MPLVLMGYYNPLLAYGLERFCADAAAAGVCGLVLPDAARGGWEMQAAARSCGLDIVYLVSPTSPEERIREVASVASGFIYCVSRRATGAASRWRSGSRSTYPGCGLTPTCRSRSASASRDRSVRQVGAVADGVVVASALLDVIDAAAPEERSRRRGVHQVASHSGRARGAEGLRRIADGRRSPGRARRRCESIISVEAAVYSSLTVLGVQ